jgi:hypothetical protein
VVPLIQKTRLADRSNAKSDKSPLSSLLEGWYSTKLGQREKRTTKQSAKKEQKWQSHITK